MLNLPISRDGFLWAFSIASQLHQVPLATTLILQKFHPPFTLASFRAAAEQTGLKVRQKAVPNSQLGKLPLPCLVTLIPAVEGVQVAINGDLAMAQHAVREYQIALLQSLDAETVVLAEACCKSTITLNRETFEKRFAGEALIITPATADGVDASQTNKKTNGADISKGPGKDGLSWSAPQMAWLKNMFRVAK